MHVEGHVETAFIRRSSGSPGERSACPKPEKNKLFLLALRLSESGESLMPVAYAEANDDGKLDRKLALVLARLTDIASISPVTLNFTFIA